MESPAMPMMSECLRLYLVTDAPEHCSLGLAETVRRAIAGGVTLVQYRREHADAATMLHEAAELREITRAAGVPFIVNNDVRLALQVGADGVHLGQSDMPVAQARKLAGQGFIIGVSVSNEQEMLAVEPHIADYVGCGPVFPTATKADAAPAVGLAGWTRLSRICPLPIVAIGGITATRACELRAAGPCDGVAVVSAICGAADPAAASRELFTALSR